ncbi:hypothetical protein [Pantoea agglomerans]|uniref:DUF3899 domain-containing protein n=1 Tax=Enterobacter agglomerans TaxID=549 RepID=A0AAN2FC87_ENTAG|nr:hypothetical protein [Pantoea agglomerans]NEG57492.1 hypothetical protein [Pantoea agglomerans]NEG97484.1 hypothetical protein [Pantoea agglomerans]NEH02952.1 hypothetical protein [Pantoea agglomerans]NEH13817.1 hypothetical protein [Pantoea agglomerans]CAH6260167.1 hypothetical protein DAPPPG734_08365 [Pantoea agglomerans]
MVIDKLLAGTSLFFGLLGSGLVFFSFFVYAAKRKDYYKLISSYSNKYKFPAPCSFYHSVGFFGAFPVIRFFIKLSQRKKIFLMDSNDPAYSFFDDKNIKIHSWMRFFSGLWFAATACLIIFAFIGLLLP